MNENKTLFRALIEVVNYSEINKSVLNPENADNRRYHIVNPYYHYMPE
jgi:histone deacetylase complex regulatory component SIN3